MKLRLLSAADLRAALPMADAVAAMKRAFIAQSSGEASAPQRGVVHAGDGITLVMGASIPGLGLGSKTVSVFSGNRARGRPPVTGLVVALDPDTGEPVALCEGTFLTAWRTGAASGAATDLLARPDARIGAVIGCGAQARTQAIAIDAVRSLAKIRVFAPRRDACEAFVATVQPELRARLDIADSAFDAIRDAGVICTATTSDTPVFDGRALAPGAHVNAVGSFRPSMRELDDETIRAARVHVDAIEAALAEAGELIHAEARGVTRRDDWTELGHALASGASRREGDASITLFKSVGLAVQDVAAAAAALAGARERGLGSIIEL